MDWSGTPTDPHGWFKLRDFLASAADAIEGAGYPAEAMRLRGAASSVSMPSEFMGESALALEATLSIPGLPLDLVATLNEALDAIRTGFRRVGDIPNF